MECRFSEKSHKVMEILPPSWDADKDIPEKNCNRIFKGLTTLMVFNFLLCDCNKKICTVFHVKYGVTTYTHLYSNKYSACS